MLIPNPGPEFFHPGSRIQGQKDSGSRIRIRIKEFKYFYPKNCFSVFGKIIRDVHPGSGVFSNPDPGVKKAPDPGSGPFSSYQ
jgi:hypothetical protein